MVYNYKRNREGEFPNERRKEKIMIKLENVTKRFGDKIAVNDVSFCIESGKITGLIGANGSGKSTTMRMIATLMTPSEGRIFINETDVVKNSQEARKQIGVLLGGDVSLYDRLTARENITYFAQLQGMEKEDIRLRIGELSKLLDMEEFLDRKAGGFSRGMRQKVAFARSIIHDPDILLLDEPSTGLDINAIKEVQDFILYCKDRGKTILLSTHNAHEMDKLCDNVVFIDNGKIMIQGNKEELLKKERLSSVADLFFCYTKGGKENA